jgi:hypothetical protein
MGRQRKAVGASPTEREPISQRDLVVRQAKVFATLGGGIHLLGEADEFLNHMPVGADGITSPNGVR